MRWLVAAGLGLVVVVAMAGPAAAICEASGAWDVATHEELRGAIVVWDSSRGLHESVDDGATWAPTGRLPLESERSAREVCLDDGRCFRIRADGLGIEQDVDGWTTVWAYPPERVEFLERQLPGACGEGHAELGLVALLEAPASSSHDLLVAAGADGLWSVDGDRLEQGLFGEPATLDASPGDLYLMPEVTATALGALMLGLWGMLWLGGRDARAQAVVIALAIPAGVLWALAPVLGIDSLLLLLGLSAVPLVAVWVAGRRLSVDAAEMVVGLVWAVAAALAVRAVVATAEAAVFAYSVGSIAAALLGVSWFVARERSQRIGPSSVWVPVAIGVVVVAAAYGAWSLSLVASKHLADAIAGAAAVGVVAWMTAPRAGRTSP